jgi:hypothetical protein
MAQSSMKVSAGESPATTRPVLNSKVGTGSYRMYRDKSWSFTISASILRT